MKLRSRIRQPLPDGRGSVTRTRNRAATVSRIAGLLFAILLAIRLYPGRPLRDLVPQSTSIWSADGELLRVTLAADGQYRLWTPLKEMSPALVDAFRLKEDRWFYWHPGVNPFSLSAPPPRPGAARAARAVPPSPCSSPGCCTT